MLCMCFIIPVCFVMCYSFITFISHANFYLLLRNHKKLYIVGFVDAVLWLL